MRPRICGPKDQAAILFLWAKYASLAARLADRDGGWVVGIYADRIRAKVTAAFQPTRLVIEDDSAHHHGHAGAHPDGSGETHFNLAIESAVFAGKSRIERQRLVHDALALELKERVHALSLKLSVPGES